MRMPSIELLLSTWEWYWMTGMSIACTATSSTCAVAKDDVSLKANTVYLLPGTNDSTFG